jgi:hypothetical protein
MQLNKLVLLVCEFPNNSGTLCNAPKPATRGLILLAEFVRAASGAKVAPPAVAERFVERHSGGAVRCWKTARNAHLLPCKLRFRAVFRLARHPPQRFATNCCSLLQNALPGARYKGVLHA